MIHSILSLLFILLLSTGFAHGQIRDFETTRLMSTAGAGVGAILVNESSFLNPASIAFYSTSSLYYQRNDSTIDEISQARANERGKFKDGDNEAIVLADTSSRIKGTFSYQRQYEDSNKRIRYTSSLANNFTEKQAFGLLYRYTVDTDSQDSSESFHQFTLGYSYIQSPKLSFGAVVIDPLETKKDDVRFLVGLHYELLQNIFLLVDVGTNYAYDAKENTITRSALQLSLFKSLYARVGQSHDKAANLKSSSWGVSWVGPILSLEYSYKTSQNISKDADYLFENEQLTEHSLALSVRF